MRLSRVKLEKGGCYHVISRVVDRTFRMDEVEKSIFCKIMRKVEAFSGVQILTYALMSNHFHILLRIPEDQGVLDEDELVHRMQILYDAAHCCKRFQQWQEWRDSGREDLVEAELEALRARMGDLSAFVQNLKQRYSISYNRRHGRKGTLWEERFKSIIIEQTSDAQIVMAAYIDLNPVRANIVDDPKDYRFSGYGEACGGNKRAMEGIAALCTSPDSPPDLQAGLREYRQHLYIAGRQRYCKLNGTVTRPGFSQEEIQKVLDQKGKLSIRELFNCRVRYLTDGMVLGSKVFVEKIFNDNRHLFGEKRKSGARKMRYAEWGDLCIMRDLRTNPVTIPDSS